MVEYNKTVVYNHLPLHAEAQALRRSLFDILVAKFPAHILRSNRGDSQSFSEPHGNEALLVVLTCRFP